MVVSFPLTQTVSHLAFDSGARDDRGNVVPAWLPPVTVAVIGWYVSSTHEPQIAGHDRVLVEAQVLAPESWVPSPRDRVHLPGRTGEYEVIGETEDYNHGPFQWRPGNVVNLKKVAG